MSNKSFESFVEGTEALRALYSGAWPCFHDAEVIEMHFWRGHVHPGDWDERNVFPIVTIKILILEATQPGATDAGHDVLASFRFYDVDHVHIQDFNHNNSIVALTVTEQPRGTFTDGDPLPPSLLVTIERGFGVVGSFSCSRMEVIAAERAPKGPLGGPLISP